MNRSHFAALAPLCPLCSTAGRGSPLQLARVLRADGGEVLEALLTCPEPSCLHEYPVVDGLPLLLADLPSLLAGQGGLLLERTDLSEEMESLLGDALGPGSAYDTARQHLSTYGESHWGDRASPADAVGEASAASFVGLVRQAFALAAPHQGEPLLDLGCALGRGSFLLADAGAAPVLGVDLHLGLLRRAASARRCGWLSYPRRQVGLVYERARAELGDFSGQREQVDFWAADAARLPFAEATFAGVAAFNLLDCVASPRDTLGEIRRVLRPGGLLWLTSPWDWSIAATPLTSWLGGHSQRSPRRGRSEDVLTALLEGDHPAALAGFELLGRIERAPWLLRLHGRSSVDYAVDLRVLRRTGSGQEV